MNPVDSRYNWELLYRLVAFLLDKVVHLLVSQWWDINLEILTDLASFCVLQPVQKLPDDPEGRRHDA